MRDYCEGCEFAEVNGLYVNCHCKYKCEYQEEEENEK
jgi:hypothetical protein